MFMMIPRVEVFEMDLDIKFAIDNHVMNSVDAVVDDSSFYVTILDRLNWRISPVISEYIEEEKL